VKIARGKGIPRLEESDVDYLEKRRSEGCRNPMSREKLGVVNQTSHPKRGGATQENRITNHKESFALKKKRRDLFRETNVFSTEKAVKKKKAVPGFRVDLSPQSMLGTDTAAD